MPLTCHSSQLQLRAATRYLAGRIATFWCIEGRYPVAAPASFGGLAAPDRHVFVEAIDLSLAAGNRSSLR